MPGATLGYPLFLIALPPVTEQQPEAQVAALSPLGVQAVVAERNELRHQVRKAAAELRKIEYASGGDSMDVVRLCAADMERMVQLRSQIELENEVGLRVVTYSLVSYPQPTLVYSCVLPCCDTWAAPSYSTARV